MGTGTELGRVRGLGSAKAGSHHWWLQRVTSIGDIVLELWLLFSLLRIPVLSHEAVMEWVKSPFTAVPLALLVINLCWHMRIGLQVVIEDYVHGGMRVIAMGLLHLWTFGAGGFALFLILKTAFAGIPALGGIPA